MEDFSLLGSLASQLHQEFTRLFYLFLPVFFALAIGIDWFRNPSGSPDFLDTLKRAIIATLLVVGFDEISHAVIGITSGVADKISDMSGLDSILKMAGEKCKTYTLSTTSLILGFNDMIVALLSFLSYIVLFIARYISVALYHFMWLLLSILSPLLILFNLFRGTQGIVVNLFRSLIEVASWKIVWAVLSAMLTALSFGNAYAADGNYLTVILLNFIIALAMLGTPLLVKSLVGSGVSSMSESLGMGAVVAMVAAPAKAATVLSLGREVLSDTAGWSRHMGQQAFSHLRGTSSPTTTPQAPRGTTESTSNSPSSSLSSPLPPPPQQSK